MYFNQINQALKCILVIFFCFSISAYAQDQPTNTSKSSKRQYCLEQAKKYQEMETTNEEEYGDNLHKAQDFYLCAEKLGDAYAGYAAAGLSEAGVVTPLPPAEIQRLYINAANAGYYLAAYELYRNACGNKQDVCSNPVEAKKWLLKAAESNDPFIFDLLGNFYEKGYDGVIDMNKAAACYKLVADKGHELAKRKLESLEASGHKIINVSCL